MGNKKITLNGVSAYDPDPFSVEMVHETTPHFPCPHLYLYACDDCNASRKSIIGIQLSKQDTIRIRDAFTEMLEDWPKG